MDINDFLDLEVTYTKIGLVTALAGLLWLTPKYFKTPIVWEIASGLCATSMVLTAAASCNRIEKRKRYERAEQAAQEDLFTMDLAHTVFQHQQQLQQQLQPPTPVAATPSHPAVAPLHAPQKPLPQAIAPSPPIPHSTATALELLQQSFQSRIFFGAQRTGKSYLAACAAQRLAERGVQVFHINLASYGDEDDRYWSGYRSVTCDLLSMSDPMAVAEHIQEAMLVVEEFKRTPQSLLIVDEWTLQCSTSNRYREELEPLNKELANQIAGLTSTGMKRERALWAIAPEFVAGELTQEGKAAKKLSLVFVAIPPGQSVNWNGQRVSFNPELYEQVRNNFPYLEMPTTTYPSGERIAFIDKSWTTVGVNAHSLTNDANAPTSALEPYQQQVIQPVTNPEANVQEPTVQGPFSWVPTNVQEQLIMAIASGQPKATSINQLLGISKGGSSAWQKASADWDQLKEMI